MTYFLRGFIGVVVTLNLLLGHSVFGRENWSEWRGDLGNGLVREKGFPLSWSSDENIRWKTELPAPGNSSPIVYGDRVFVTCANVDGTERSLLSFDRENGHLLWQQTIHHEEHDPTHATNPWCAASPTTDGERVYVWNGSAGATAYDFAGKQLWHRDLGEFAHQWGHASSPRTHKDTVIIFGSPGPRVILIALNKYSGETVWEFELDHITSPPQELYGSFATPLLWDNDGRAEMLLPLPGYLASYDPDSGKELWRCEGLGTLIYTDAMVGEDVVLAFSGYRGPAIGMRLPGPNETGNLTQSHRLWKDDTVLQRVGSGVIVGDRFFLSGRRGELHGGDIYSGKLAWKHDLREQAWSSITLVDDKLYVTDQASVTYVFEPADSFKLIQKNAMNPQERSNSTLAFSGDQLFLRTHKALYLIETGNPSN